MCTRMSEEDWEHTILVFRACLPRRGRKGVDDRLFLEALHLFTVENVRWRALPERYSHWNSVWKRFNRLDPAPIQVPKTHRTRLWQTQTLLTHRSAMREN